MTKSTFTVRGREIPVLHLSAAVIGSGCAGFNAADWLFDLGVRDAAVITEGVNMGTSRNTGSDKQTYYKLSLASDGEDSVARLAEDLFAGTGVNGDTAYAEAACSARSFIKLANLGVPFPTNEYGEYVGYKTDHDPRQRATSAGPLTSRYMTEALERSVRAKNIPIIDGLTAIELLVEDNRVRGLVCVDKNSLGNGCFGLTLVCAKSVILATGGPAAVYANRVYPESQTGMTGMALLAGAKAANLHEWQYGLASVKFRWNVSGTYQQVLPRYVSVDEDGNEREFLPEYFGSPQKALDMVFLKGYQWPFDTKKLGGSSVIDLIVHREIFGLNRRVFMDFRTDPAGLENGFGGLSAETRDYLANSDALVKTPIARLLRMNAPAVELYLNNGIDLRSQPLEVSVCAQHHNGGLAVDANWQTSVRGLYAAGEAAGTFGVSRPGGSALNSAQVGSMRAAEQIAYNRGNRAEEEHIAYNRGNRAEEEHIAYNRGNRAEEEDSAKKVNSAKMSNSTDFAKFDDFENSANFVSFADFANFNDFTDSASFADFSNFAASPDFADFARPYAEVWFGRLDKMTSRAAAGLPSMTACEDFSREMSSIASYIRDTDKMKRLAESIQKELRGFDEDACVDIQKELIGFDKDACMGESDSGEADSGKAAASRPKCPSREADSGEAAASGLKDQPGEADSGDTAASHPKDQSGEADTAETAVSWLKGQPREADSGEAVASGLNYLINAVKARDTMVTQLAVLSAMIKSAEAVGTRGSALVLGEGGEPVNPALPMFISAPEKPQAGNQMIMTQKSGGDERLFESFFEPVRPLPKPGGWFETVWKEFQERRQRLVH